MLFSDNQCFVVRGSKKYLQLKKNVYFCTLKPKYIMSHKTAIRLYEIASYVLILGATAVYFMLKDSPMRLSLTMMLVAVAIAMRWMMERHRSKAAEEEIDQLNADLRRLTQLLAEEKKKNNNQ